MVWWWSRIRSVAGKDYIEIETMGIPAKVWVPDIGEVEPQALEQIKKMGAIAGAVGWLAIMPDVHLGKGAVVGGGVATKGRVVPNIVGVAIG